MDIEAKKKVFELKPKEIFFKPDESKDITLKPSCFFNAIHADNEIIVFTNSRRIYYSHRNNDDLINDRVRLRAKKGHNHVNVIGINWRGTSHFHFQIIIQQGNPYVDEILEEVDVRPGGIGAIYQGFFHFFLNSDPRP